MAGLVAARRLAAAGKSVVVIDSGGAAFDPMLHKLNEVDAPLGPYASASNGRFRGLGGSSTRWGGRFLPITSFDAGDRPHLGLRAWPFDVRDLDVHRAEIEALFKLDNSSYEEDALDALDGAGVVPRGDPDFGMRLPKWAPFNRCNLANVLGDELDAMQNVDVWLEATACEFAYDTENARISALVARNLAGQSLTVCAREFIIAAGTIEATRLLLLLNASTGGQAFSGCRVLGHYLQDHLGAKVADLRPRDTVATNRFFGYRFTGSTRRSIHLDLSPVAQVEDKVASAFAHVTMRPGKASSTKVLKQLLRGRQSGQFALSGRDVARLIRESGSLARGLVWRYARKQHFWPPDLEHQMNVWIEQVPHHANRISLSEKCDPFGIPMARVEWAPRDAEERAFQACIARLRSYWERHDCDRFCELDWTVQAGDDVNSVAKAVFHPSGSTRMGIDPTESVVDLDLRCHRVPNLSVASASVFPTAGAAGPTYTLLAIAMRTADAVAERLQSAAVAQPLA
jgi:choline dehydrogenase-like flavoprotein